MNYEEKYKEAIEGIQEILSSGQESIQMSRLKLRLQGIFPELKESGDERIRKALIRFHKSTIDVDGIKGEDILAWLEKQGELEKQKGETLSGWWVARDRDGDLYVYNVKPERNVDSWAVPDSNNLLKMPNKLFPDLKWEDDPLEVNIIIKTT